MDLDFKEIKRLIDASDTRWSDRRTNSIPTPADLITEIAPMDDSYIVQIPLEMPVFDEQYIKEELPDEPGEKLEARGIWTFDLLGD